MSTKTGWQGRFFEDFAVGDVYEHALGRTISETDNTWFTLLTMNTNPIHVDGNYAAKTEFGQRLVNSTLTLAIVTGLSVQDVSQNAVNLGWEYVKLPNPVFEGDTVYAYSEILATRPSGSRPHMGVVTFKTVGVNQERVPVLELKRSILVYRKGWDQEA